MTDTTETAPTNDEVEDVSDLSNQTDEHADDAEDDDDPDLAEGEEAGDDDEEGEDDLVEMKWDGKTVRVPASVKAGLLRQADYTRKTQTLSDDRKALETERTSLRQQAERSKEVDADRLQYHVIESQLKALDKMDWDKLEEDDPAEANRLWRQRGQIRDKQIELAGQITQMQQTLELDRKRSADAAHVTAVQETEAVLQKDIKGWNRDLAIKVGEFAVNKLGWSPQHVLRATDPVVIKTIHAAYVGDQAQRRLRQQEKLEAGDKTAPVRSPGGGGASPNARRTTDGSGDKLTTAEWMKREQQRTAEARKARR